MRPTGSPQLEQKRLSSATSAFGSTATDGSIVGAVGTRTSPAPMRLRVDEVRLDVRVEADDDDEPVVGFVRDGATPMPAPGRDRGPGPRAGRERRPASGARPQVLQ